MPKMNSDDFSSLFRGEVQGAVNYYDTEFSEDRTNTLSYYLGDPFGNEVDGRSQVVATEVSDVIEFMMPSLMRVFGDGDFARCRPRQAEDTASAEQATEYLNFVLNSQNPGAFSTIGSRTLCFSKSAWSKSTTRTMKKLKRRVLKA